MKVSKGELINDLLPAFQKISEMQSGGLLMLSAKTSYALAKNLGLLLILDRDLDKFQKEQMELYVNKTEDGKKFAITMEGDKKEWDFKEGKKGAYSEAMKTFLDAEIDWNPHRVSSEEIQNTPNFPIHALTVLEQYEVITELKIPDLKRVVN